MDTQPKSRASVNREQNAKLLCELLQRSEPLLRQQARKHAELPEDAEDALQSAYVLFIERYRGDWEPLPWLQTTVKREAWALRRKVSRRRVVSLDSPNGSADSEQTWVEGLPSTVHDPEEKALRSEEIKERRRLLAELKADQRRALGLFGAGLSYAEICQATGWTYTNVGRIRAVLGVDVEGRPLHEWPYRELRRRHALMLVDYMLREQGRATSGASNILRSLSAMSEDAITDEIADLNPFRGVRVRGNDPRAQKPRRPVRVFSFAEMHRFARAGRWEPMIRVFTDCGLRLGEVLPLRSVDFDGQVLAIRRTADEGVVLEGTKTDHAEGSAGRIVPCPPSLAHLLSEMPTRIDTDLLFPTPTGRLWRGRNFYRDVWYPTQEASGIDIRPHECRHSYITHLRAVGINDADLAEVAGHRVETMLSRYTHPVGVSFEQIRKAIG